LFGEKMRDCEVPFLLCIPVEKRGNAVEALGEYQRKHYGTAIDVDLRARLPELPAPEIPVGTDMTPEELGEFMARPPEHQEKLE
jgi:hypothetical protein